MFKNVNQKSKQKKNKSKSKKKAKKQKNTKNNTKAKAKGTYKKQNFKSQSVFGCKSKYLASGKSALRTFSLWPLWPMQFRPSDIRKIYESLTE